MSKILRSNYFFLFVLLDFTSMSISKKNFEIGGSAEQTLVSGYQDPDWEEETRKCPKIM